MSENVFFLVWTGGFHETRKMIQEFLAPLIVEHSRTYWYTDFETKPATPAKGSLKDDIFALIR